MSKNVSLNLIGVVVALVGLVVGSGLIVGVGVLIIIFKLMNWKFK